jgi:hypothetical protein
MKWRPFRISQIRRHIMISRVGCLSVAVLGLWLVTGCASPAGTWELQQIVPPEADRDFTMRTIELESNGNFKAEAMHEGELTSYQGTYTYDEDTGLITFRDTRGGEHQYIAELEGMGQMNVTNVGTEKEWKAEFKRQ